MDDIIDIDFEEKKDKLSILLVEDSIAETILIKQKFKSFDADISITSVANLREAKNECKNIKFGLILLDLNLPDGFGPKSVEDIRKINKTASLVVLTGFAPDITSEQAIKYGATSVIGKSEFMSYEDISTVSFIKNALVKHLR